MYMVDIKGDAKKSGGKVLAVRAVIKFTFELKSVIIF